MTAYNFDEIVDRKNTNCLKYDFAVERKKPADVLPLWVADMDFRVPPAVTEVLAKRVRHGIFGYTNYKPDYTEVLQKWFQKQHNWLPTEESLVITPGVVFALATAVRAFTRPGDAVLVQRPVYYPFSRVIEANGRELVNNPLVFQDGRYEIDFVDFEQKIKEHPVKLFLLCNPHNPVGRVWSKAELERLGDICVKYGVIVVSDEIHQAFVRQGHEHTVFSSIKPEFAACSVICTAPSKTFNLAGLQVSNIFIADKILKERFQRNVYQTGYDEPNTLGLAAAQAAYAHGGEWLAELKVYLENNLRKTKVFLRENLPQVKLIEPEGTYLLWLDFREFGLPEEELERKIVHEAKLWLDAGEIFGPEGRGFERINMACPWVTLEECLKRLVKAFAVN